MFTWSFDAPTGVYKSHAMSMKLFEAAIAECVFMDHVQPVDGFGRGRGETVTLTRVSELSEPTSGIISETDRIPEDNLTLSTVAITVNEYGRAVPYTELSTDLSEFSLENPIQRVLRNQLTKVLDGAAATAYKTAKLKYAPTGAASYNLATGGTFGTAALSNLNVFHVETIRDKLYDTYYCPMINNEYIGIFRTLALRGIKRDPAWEEWHKYTDPAAKYNGEVGKLEGVRFIETNHSTALSTGIGTGAVLGEGVVFGEDNVAMAEAVTPELRAGMPEDFGRSKSVAWYGVLEFGNIWDTANAGESRIIHVGST